MAYLWILTTLVASVAQTARNAMQRSLTETLGTVGASQVRFLYGFPFALLFLLAVSQIGGEAAPAATGRYLAWVLGGAVTQILATVLMLATMRERSFAVTTAYIKTEPVQVAIFGLLFLGDHLTLGGALAIVVATAGVVMMAVKPGSPGLTAAGLRPAVLGIVAGAFFALSAIGFRGAILTLESGSFVLRATTTLAWSLGMQTALLVVWLGLFDRPALMKSFGAWRPSLMAGFAGAFASQFWFLGFSLTSAANVRTLALVEVLLAQAVSKRLFGQETTAREIIGMTLIVGGVVLLLWTHGT
ncbi:DMT transporter permease [Alsobacter metallidurans]|uniref:DMT transporter permease n=1 Tax=Alsobacter metallidurans TaxID=340221 RepID=A0A917MKA0_9HYPH|nr:DMT family transporter [Alsobacter metallidurans]GGH31345.1 DMT transporter permease [Alsobacter metallidurans]